MYIDNQLVLSKWIDQYATTYSVTRAMSAGNHKVTMDYYERGGSAVAKLNFKQVTFPTSPAPIVSWPKHVPSKLLPPVHESGPMAWNLSISWRRTRR